MGEKIKIIKIKEKLIDRTKLLKREEKKSKTHTKFF